jgi:hypothetical protein
VIGIALMITAITTGKHGATVFGIIVDEVNIQ